MQRELQAQGRHVASLREELESSEKEHSDLVRQLHAQLKAPLSDGEAPQPKTSINDILDPNKLGALLDRSAAGTLKMDECVYELMPEDKQELEARATQLPEGISGLAGNLFRDAKEKVGALRQEHEAHLKRLAAKRLRSDSGEKAANGPGSAGACAAAAPDDSPPPAEAKPAADSRAEGQAAASASSSEPRPGTRDRAAEIAAASASAWAAPGSP
ncbi:unnamed protein product [Prorocentrum cordatum]|uniref:Uncharacterized protein n=1 Tax=Prorocentrum cordatum TaxID=2364126 RepID=A0ABN9RRE9_9DINO|nr:unnamed protein product [Polarella glacialis]